MMHAPLRHVYQFCRILQKGKASGGEGSAVEVPAKFATYCIREADTPKAVEEVDFNEK